MTDDIFAKLGDIKGESLDAKHKDEIEVLSFSWAVRPLRPPVAAGWHRQGDLPGSDHQPRHR